MWPRRQALVLILAAPLALAGETPLDVDAHKVLALAVAAVSERFPEISADELAVDGSLDFQCWLTRPNETVLALEGEFRPCIATANFVVAPGTRGRRYVDADGKCHVMRGPENIKVRIGGGEIDPDCARGSFGAEEDLVVECTEEFDDAESWASN